jgi:hypothetical protein
VDRDEALALLPWAHARALRLDALGADAALIADCLGIEPESVQPLLEVAAAKLARAQEIDLRDVDQSSPVAPIPSDGTTTQP